MRYFEFFDLITGGRVWPTGRQQLRKYHRQQLDAFHKEALRQPSPIPNDTRPRGTCPECLEMMLVGASTCPYCQTTGIVWPTEKTVVPLRVCRRCAGDVYLNDRHQVNCSSCKAQYSSREYPHLSAP
jgi:DnaJ-class molecular chaperone